MSCLDCRVLAVPASVCFPHRPGRAPIVPHAPVARSDGTAPGGAHDVDAQLRQSFTVAAMTTIDIDELMPALEAEQQARSKLELIGLELRKVHRAKGKPTPESIAALRAAAIELVSAGQGVL